MQAVEDLSTKHVVNRVADTDPLLIPTLQLDVKSNQRLYNMLDGRLGLSVLTDRELLTVLQSVTTGLKHLSRLNYQSNAFDWARTFEDLSSLISGELGSDWRNPNPSIRHPILQVLIDQPAPSRGPEQRKSCLAIGALAFMTIGFNVGRVNAGFWHGLKQLFRSSQESWQDLIRTNTLEIDALKKWSPQNQVAIVDEFRQGLIDLHRHAIPALASYQKRDELVESLPSTFAAAAPAAATLQKQTATSPKERKDPFDDLSPRLDLFEVQKQRDCQDDVVDGYRLALNWNRLHSGELKHSLGKLVVQLKTRPADDTARRFRTHAAARFVSLLSGLSLKKCLHLPLGRRGSMKLDIKKGVIRRDLLLVAPRTDQQHRKRVNGRWWRTRLPKEVRDTFQELLAENPHAKTLGDLLKAEGLTYELCQHMLNDGWPSSHRPEDTRFALSLRPCLLDLGIHPAVVSRLTGDVMTTPASDHYYLSFTELQLHEAMVTFWNWAGLTPPDVPVRNRVIGTPKAISKQEFGAAIQRLNQKVFAARAKLTPRSNIQQIIGFHNLYTTAVALQLVWGTGARGDRIYSLTFERLFASEEYMAFSDRRVDRYSRQRIVPSTVLLTSSREHYLEHLRSIADSLERVSQTSADYVVQVVSGNQPHDCAFSIFEETPAGWTPRALTRKDLVKLAEEIGIKDLNASRHFWFTELVDQQVAQVAIEALLGHHINGAEAFGFSSGISVGELCDYIRPILQEVQEQLHFEPLVGRGRQARRFLGLPELAVKGNLRPLPNVLLQRKLEVQDFLIPEVKMYEQDPPSTCKTLVAHSQLSRLNRNYLNSDLVAKFPAGAALYCLIALELVLTPVEQRTLFHAAVTNGLWRVGSLAVVEAVQDGRPVAQRCLSKHTVGAAQLARNQHKNAALSFTTACAELHQLLKQLEPNWRGKSPDSSVTLLSTMAGHWAAVEIPYGALFGVFHKAPFVPVNDLARIFLGRPCLPQSWEVSPHQNSDKTRAKDFPVTLAIVTKWANKDLPFGEEGIRSKGCLADLKERGLQNEVDEAEQLLIDLLCADLSSHPPYRTLSATTLPEYARGYAIFFVFVRNEGTPELDAETWLEAYEAMGGPKDRNISGPVRWQMLHLSAFFQSKGFWAPSGFLSNKGKKKTFFARIPAYTSQSEIAAVKSRLDQVFHNRGGTYKAAGIRLQLQRSIPLRASEVRYSRPCDFDKEALLFHITSTGHNHLKSEFSRGSAILQEPFGVEVASMCASRNAISVGADTLLFCDSHLQATYAAFDTISDAIRDETQAVTGCLRFRQHDLRVSAVSDACFEFVSELTKACEGQQPNAFTHDAQSISKKHRRFAYAAKLARHATPLTSLRYYNCTGVLDLHHHTEISHTGIEFSASYLAALTGTKAQTFYAASHRARHSKSQLESEVSVAQPLEQRLFAHIQSICQSLPTPPLGNNQGSCSEDTTKSNSPSASLLIEACLLVALGASISEASDTTLLPREAVNTATDRLNQYSSQLKINTVHGDKVSTVVSVVGGKDHYIGNLIRKYARLILKEKSVFTGRALALITGFSRCGSRLILKNELLMRELVPVLAALGSVGFRVVFKLGPDRIFSDYPALKRELELAHVEVHRDHSKEDVFGVVSFLFATEPPTKNQANKHRKSASTNPQIAVEAASPRSYGRAGRLAVAGCLLALSL